MNPPSWVSTTTSRTQRMLLHCLVWSLLSSAALATNCSDDTQRVTRSVARIDASATSDWTMVAALLESDGAVILENAASEEWMMQLADELEADRSATFRGEEGSFAGHDITRNSAKPLGESEIARRLAADEKILAVVERHLSPYCNRIRLGAATAMYVDPPENMDEDPAPAQVLHRDDALWEASEWMSREGQCHNERPALSVSVMWAVSNFTEHNGATRVALGSHKQCPRTKLPTEDMDLDLALLNPGDCILWTGGTFHGAGARSKPSDVPGGLTRHESTRKGMFFFYNLGWLYPEHNFFNAIPLSVINTFPQKLKSLMGYDGQNAIPHPWYTGPVYSLPYLGGPNGHPAGDSIGAKQTK